MKIHEYQAKKVLSESGIPVPEGAVASTPGEAREVAAGLGGKSVVKAQVHAGGRGKAGGIKVVSSAAEAERVAGSLLGSRLVTSQTGPAGVLVNHVLVEEALDVERELYAGMVIDGAAERIVVMASESGGMDIEEVALRTPEKLLRTMADPMLGLLPYQCRMLAYGLNVNRELVRPIARLLGDLYRIFERLDCSLIEINPLVVTGDGRVIAADAKLDFDDDALFRHPELQELRDPEQEDPLEARAREFGISYVKLEGHVGCMVNGAGLAMATMDLAGAVGSAPANFLDVGGGADEKKVAEALKIILSDPSVKKVLINIFGGILRCDIVARGMVMATQEMPDVVRPMVVRMLGTNADEGSRILANSDLNVTVVTDLTEAAQAIKAQG
jgi:succinyl-CoA synthetase beta subunit